MLTHPSFWWSFGLPFQFLAQCLPDEVYRWRHHTEKHWDTGANPYHERRFLSAWARIRESPGVIICESFKDLPWTRDERILAILMGCTGRLGRTAREHWLAMAKSGIHRYADGCFPDPQWSRRRSFWHQVWQGGMLPCFYPGIGAFMDQRRRRRSRNAPMSGWKQGSQCANVRVVREKGLQGAAGVAGRVAIPRSWQSGVAGPSLHTGKVCQILKQPEDTISRWQLPPETGTAGRATAAGHLVLADTRGCLFVSSHPRNLLSLSSRSWTLLPAADLAAGSATAVAVFAESAAWKSLLLHTPRHGNS